MAAKLTGWNVDIDGADESGIEETADAVQDEPKTMKTKDLEDSLISAATEAPKEDAVEPQETQDKPDTTDDNKEDNNPKDTKEPTKRRVPKSKFNKFEFKEVYI